MMAFHVLEGNFGKTKLDGVVFGVPLWLVAEELLHRAGPHLKAAAVRANGRAFMAVRPSVVEKELFGGQ
jgi:hypothetical protein